MNRFAAVHSFAIGVFLLPMLLVGCSEGNAPTGDVRAARGVLRVLGIEYGNYLAAHDNQPPADKTELTEFIETRKDRIPGLQSVEQLFSSPRDNQPLMIYYGEMPPPLGETGYPAVACEQQGGGGHCLIADIRGGVLDIPQGEVPAHLKPAQ